MREFLEQQYRNESLFMKTYDETIKSVIADNDKIDNFVQAINKGAAKLQENVQAAKPRQIQLLNSVVSELLKPKTHYKRILQQIKIPKTSSTIGAVWKPMKNGCCWTMPTRSVAEIPVSLA